MLEILQEYDVLGAFWVTIQLTFCSAIGSLVLGTILAVMRVCPSRVLRGSAPFYVNTVRNTPLTLSCLLRRWAALRAQIRWRPLTRRPRCGTTRSAGRSSGCRSTRGLRLRGAALAASTPCPSARPRRPASIGLTFTSRSADVILPQAFRGAIAPLGSVLIALTKNTTVAAIIGVAEARA